MPVAGMAARVCASGSVIRIVINVPRPSAANLVSTCRALVGQLHALHVNDPAEGLQFQMVGHMKASL